MNTTLPEARNGDPRPLWARLHAALMPDYNRKAAVYWWAMVALGLAALINAGLVVAALPRPTLLHVLAGCVVAALAGMFPVRIPGSKNSFAAGEIFIFLLLMMYGPAAATLAAAGESFIGSARTSKRWTSRLVSPAVAAIGMTVIGSAFQATAQSLAAMAAFNEALLMLSAMVFAVAYFLLNILLIKLVVHLKRSEALSLQAIFGDLQWVGITYAASSLIAALLYLTFKQIGIAVVVASIPMIAMLLSTLHYHLRQREADDAARLVRIDAAERESALAAQHARALGDSERRFHSAFSHAAIGMALVSPDGHVLQANPALCSLLGSAEEDVVGHRFADFVHADDVQALSRRLLDAVSQVKEDTAVELRCRHRQGHEVWVAVHSGYFSERDSSAPCLILQAQDVTARRAAESRLQHVAYYDSLTKLANRAHFGRRLAQALDRCQEDRSCTFAVMYLDFDRFKLINDTLGHSAGDEFLVMVAQRIREQVRPADTVGRLGGDEFAILVEDLDGEEPAVALAERLQAALRKPYVVGGSEINSSASIGITFSSIGYSTPDEVLRDADIAMYRAKSGGRARYAVFDAALRAQISDQVQLEADLRRAIERDELALAYQPIYDLQSGQVVSFEALARWNHPQRGPIPPDTFIPIAEEAGLIAALTKRVLSGACRQLKAWHRLGNRHGQLRMQVNLSGIDLCHGTLAHDVTTTLEANGLAASHLTLEITESTLMTRLDSVLEMMKRLRDTGVGLSVDDFGTGYSSLSYLSTLPITSLKIDRSFVSRLMSGAKDCEIVRAIVTLGNVLGKTVVAEGIETPAQLAQLRDMGCGFGQGFLLAPPLSADMAQELLDRSPVADPGVPVLVALASLSPTVH